MRRVLLTVSSIFSVALLASCAIPGLSSNNSGSEDGDGGGFGFGVQECIVGEWEVDLEADEDDSDEDFELEMTGSNTLKFKSNGDYVYSTDATASTSYTGYDDNVVTTTSTSEGEIKGTWEVNEDQLTLVYVSGEIESTINGEPVDDSDYATEDTHEPTTITFSCDGDTLTLGEPAEVDADGEESFSTLTAWTRK